MWQEQLQKQLAVHEGKTNKIYTDTVGKVTCGVGHNLSDKGVSDAVVALMLEEDIADAIEDVKKLVPGFEKLSDNRKVALTDMCFNLGYTRMAGFKNTLRFINSGQFDKAADNMLQSLWARQVKGRAIKLANMVRNG
jgi:lysozyme